MFSPQIFRPYLPGIDVVRTIVGNEECDKTKTSILSAEAENLCGVPYFEPMRRNKTSVT